MALDDRGEMLKYWQQNPMPAEDFVIERMGQEVRQFLEAHRQRPSSTPAPDKWVEPTPEQSVRFRSQGEVHRWMYDRYSLRLLLERTGFGEVQVCSARQSRIPRFETYGLDLNPDGSARKPDSLFMEAIKPGAGAA